MKEKTLLELEAIPKFFGWKIAPLSSFQNNSEAMLDLDFQFHYADRRASLMSLLIL